MAGTQEPARHEGFTADERAAMKEHAAEIKARRARGAKPDEDDEAGVLAKIAEMAGEDREIAERFHALVREHAPSLTARLWYGMPAYAKAGKILCFFQPGLKFKTRYSTIGFNDVARLDDGSIWPVAYAITSLTPDDEARLAALLTRAVD
jgi:uncharacterized protein YdhG (YjbR/CyaY superfamily)